MIEIIIFFVLYVTLFVMSENKLSLIYWFLSTIFYSLVMLGYFYVMKSGGEFQVFFPDEMTYINGESQLLYSQYVHYLFDTVGPIYFKAINFFVYNATWIILLNRYYSGNLQIKEFLLLILAAIGNYWCFFLLKESLSISATIILLYGIVNRVKLSVVIGVMVLFLARPELILIIFLSLLLFKIYKRNKFFFLMVIAGGFALILFILSLPESVNFKAGILARRFGESNKAYDAEGLSAAALQGLSFFLSGPYIDTFIRNINNSFNMLFNSFGLASLLIIINLVGIGVAIKRVMRKKGSEFIDWYLASAVMSLLLTHSVYRYMNAIVLPYLAIVLIRKKN